MNRALPVLLAIAVAGAAAAAPPAPSDEEERFVALMEDLALVFEDVGQDCPVLVATLDDWLDRNGETLRTVGPPVLAIAATSVATSRRVEGTLSPLVAPVTAARGTCTAADHAATFARLDAVLAPPPAPAPEPGLPPAEVERIGKGARKLVARMARLDDDLTSASGDCAASGQVLTRFVERHGASLSRWSADYYAATVQGALPRVEQDLLEGEMRGPVLRLLRLGQRCPEDTSVIRGVAGVQAALGDRAPR